MALPGQSKPVTRTLGIASAPSHTSQKQFDGWKRDLQDLCDIQNQLPSKQDQPKLVVEKIATKIRGMGTDHAEDQKKLSRLIQAWKISSDREVRGHEILTSLNASAMLGLLLQETEQLMAKAGGLEKWNSLSEEVLEQKQADVFQALCIRLGEDAYAHLSEEDQKAVDQYFWGGCCMHKELNTVGNTCMRAWWQAAGVKGPCLLPNKAAAGSITEGQSAEAGAVKATSLAGSIFNNRDDKKGQHNACRNFFEQKLSYQVRFPDTSNTRFQSHCHAAEALLVHLELYKEFMEQVRDSKKDIGFTNIEANVYKTLSDIPTLTEMAVLVLYSQAISHPYMRTVRNHKIAARNLLDLGPFHEKVKMHCRSIIDQPELLLAADSTHKIGALDGKAWQRPDAVYKVQSLVPSMPHIRGALVAFFQGAVDGWEKFSAEFADDSNIPAATSAGARVFINATNDHNEGALGALRVALRRRPNMSLHQHNARALYKTNEASDFLLTLDADDRQYLRKAARVIDSSKTEQKRWLDLAGAQEMHVAQKRAKIEVREAKKIAVDAGLDCLTPQLDVEELLRNPGTGPDLIQQIEWHRRHDLQCLKSTVLRGKTAVRVFIKDEKKRTLAEAIKRFNAHRGVCTMQGTAAMPINTPATQDAGPSTGAAGGYDRYDEDCESDEEL